MNIRIAVVNGWLKIIVYILSTWFLWISCVMEIYISIWGLSLRFIYMFSSRTSCHYFSNYATSNFPNTWPRHYLSFTHVYKSLPHDIIPSRQSGVPWHWWYTEWLCMLGWLVLRKEGCRAPTRVEDLCGYLLNFFFSFQYPNPLSTITPKISVRNSPINYVLYNHVSFLLCK